MVQGAGMVGRVGVVTFVIIDINFLHLFIFDNIFLRIEYRRFWGIEIEK